MIDENEKINIHYYYTYESVMGIKYVGFYYNYEGDDEVRDRYIEADHTDEVYDVVYDEASTAEYVFDKKHEISKQHFELLLARDKL